ncbi:MAG TPA: peptidase inhibitor family I36 protein [Vicinamibacterales bacterium]|nr:peptidase inhibitor family I36 protein [Vicinamibacterales bacterium]
MRAVVAALVVSVLGVPAVASAQRWGRERFPDAGACFFRDADFRGEYFCVRAGADVPRVPDDMNDQISSIRIFGPASVVVFRDIRFGGDSSRFGRDVRNLRGEGWNDRLSSLRVEGPPARGERFGDLDNDQRGRDRDGRAARDADRIVRRAYQDVLGRDPDEGGLRQYRSRILDDRWTEEQVRNSLRTSPEFASVRRARAEDVVRKAYRNMLKRDPDAGGAEAYIQHVLNDNWSQQDVERDLRRSPEYRGGR